MQKIGSDLRRAHALEDRFQNLHLAFRRRGGRFQDFAQLGAFAVRGGKVREFALHGAIISLRTGHVGQGARVPGCNHHGQVLVPLLGASQGFHELADQALARRLVQAR